ncbi:MAG TPA: hypothetical protein GXX39_03560 [Syntrophothermus lipocalidus]|uniref:Uncharacterized protein n=1 Tax=Syntrophothermus lipocalidus (strain DSM 12680 / TGB-C1) TaxID=643648 RepID=D7CPB4_SYNLT|nr:hypothetical protein [Syntrophothermus lipocalidus]ADI02549.1 hypothetical protein Slip_1794 [Syntrophothermus lipocalidus DSM 12680]HHV76435.1 hypothetical protein [Syntrophothermus lipocalidus]
MKRSGGANVALLLSGFLKHCQYQDLVRRIGDPVKDKVCFGPGLILCKLPVLGLGRYVVWAEENCAGYSMLLPRNSVWKRGLHVE